MIWKASNERVVIQTAEKPKQTAGGIILPDKSKSSKVEQGIVLAVGGDVKVILPGDRVFYEAKFATEIGTNVVSIESISVLAAVRDE